MGEVSKGYWSVIFALCFVTLPSVRAELKALQTKNSTGRTGSVYFPNNYTGQAVPLMIAFHGTGGSGQQIASQFSALADQKNFIILAPDSRVSPSGEFTWEVAHTPGYISPDVVHTSNCITEVTSMPKVAFNFYQVIALGFSGGGSLAPYFASLLKTVSAFAVLHGGVIPNGLGSSRPRGWFSTGQSDTIRSVSQVQSDMQSVAGIFSPLEWRTFPGGHELLDAEKSAVVSWWLGLIPGTSQASSIPEGSSGGIPALDTKAIRLPGPKESESPTQGSTTQSSATQSASAKGSSEGGTSGGVVEVIFNSAPAPVVKCEDLTYDGCLRTASGGSKAAKSSCCGCFHFSPAGGCQSLSDRNARTFCFMCTGL